MRNKGKYLHYKGNFYTVIGFAKHTETEEEFVVYYPNYKGSDPANNDDERVYSVRPYEMFFENVTVDGVEQPRFKYIEPGTD